MRYKILFLLLMIVTFSSCNNDPKSGNDPASKAETETTVPIAENNQQTTTPATTQTNAGGEAAAEGEGPGLNLWISKEETTPGAEVCLQAQASGVAGVISMQYSMRWDPKVLRFKEIKNFNLSGLDANDFGLNRVKEGVLTSVWIEDNLRGVDLRKKTPIFQLCFDVVGKKGEESAVRFWTTPTPFESVVIPEKVVPISPHRGGVKVR